MALRRRQNDTVGADTVVHRAGHGLFDAELDAVERRASPAEREDAGRLLRVVADEPGRHRGHGRFGQRQAVRRIVETRFGL